MESSKNIQLINADPTKLSLDDLLSRAARFIFGKNAIDSTATIAYKNMKYGLAKMHIAQQELGYEPNACVIFGPDATISMNVNRWNAGYGYGCKIVNYTDLNDEPIVFPQQMANSCGETIFGIKGEKPDKKELRKLINELPRSEDYLTLLGEEVRIKWDLHIGNHFSDVIKPEFPEYEGPENKVYESIFYEKQEYLKKFDYFLIVHGSGPIVKQHTYLHKSKEMQERVKVIETDLGSCPYLIGEDAKWYFNIIKDCNQFSNERRELFAKKAYGNRGEVINSVIHQGIITNDLRFMHLGCQDTTDFPILPAGFNYDTPFYLYMGLPNFDRDVIDELDLNWFTRADNRGLGHILEKANILEHGGGYKIYRANKFKKIEGYKDGERDIICKTKNHQTNWELDVGKKNEFIYRGQKVIDMTEDLQLGTPLVKGKILF